MMRKIIILLMIAFPGLRAASQLVVNLQTPPSGFTYKPQLWTMLLTNTGNAAISLHIEVSLTPAGSSQQVVTGATNVFLLAPGTTQINASLLSPIQYNVLNNAYALDPNPYGLLPMGHFNACFNFFRHNTDNVQELSEQCEEIFVEPLSPPQLVYPFDQTAIDETHPQFTWLPPVPVNLFNHLGYDLELVEVNTNQSAPDAIQQNIPLFQQSNLTATSLLYSLSAPALEYGKNYAWRIIAKANGSPVGTSETWQFSLKHYGTLTATSPTEMPYVKLKKAPESGYALFISELKFDYVNETADSIWNIKVSDLTTIERNSISLDMDTIKLAPGPNLVRYTAPDASFFIDRHFYLLEIFNARNETWRLRFEFRKPNE